jgi:hypothetical protein
LETILKLKMVKKNKQKKGKKANKQTKKQSRPPRGTTKNSIVQKMGSHGPTMNAVHTACGMLDPFCSHAHGMKIHDENSARSSTYRSLNVYVMTSNSTGSAMNTYSMNPSQCGYTGTVTGLITTAWTGLGNNSFYTMMNTQVSGWRCVSFGVRVFCQMSAFNAAGTVTVTEIHGINPSTSSTWSCAGTTLGQNVKVFPLAGANIHWIGRSTGINGNMYQTDVNNQDYDAFTQLIIGISGAPASVPVATVEVITNYEFIGVPNTAIAAAATAAAPSVPAIMTARANAAGMLDTLQNVQSTAAYSADILQKITQTGIAVNSAASQVAPAFRTAKTLGALAGLLL